MLFALQASLLVQAGPHEIVAGKRGSICVFHLVGHPQRTVAGGSGASSGPPNCTSVSKNSETLDRPASTYRLRRLESQTSR